MKADGSSTIHWFSKKLLKILRRRNSDLQKFMSRPRRAVSIAGAAHTITEKAVGCPIVISAMGKSGPVGTRGVIPSALIMWILPICERSKNSPSLTGTKDIILVDLPTSWSRNAIR